MLYRLLFALVIRWLPAEFAHRVSFATLIALTRIPGMRALLQRVLGPSDPALRTTVFGMNFPSPFGLAAGFDKNGKGIDALAALGFGFIEIGTITAHAQPGNPRPRLFRLLRDRAIINRMGFNNNGSTAVANKLRTRKNSATVLGINIGKTKKTTDAETINDYVTSAQMLGEFADYVVVNVSSPNTPGLRNLQAVTQLRPLLTRIRTTLDSACTKRVPLLVKIAPDLSNADIDAIADLAFELKLDGLIATNTTISRENLCSPANEVTKAGAGGLSGPPLRERSLDVLRRLHAKVGGRLVLISVGGVESGEDVWQRLAAGAQLVQGYTGFIYHGPLWPYRINRELSRRLQAAGLTSVQKIAEVS